MKKTYRRISFFLIIAVMLNIFCVSVYADLSSSIVTQEGNTNFINIFPTDNGLYAYDSDGKLYKHTGTGYTDGDFSPINNPDNLRVYLANSLERWIPIPYGTKIIIPYGNKVYDTTSGTFSDFPTTGYSITATTTFLGLVNGKAYFCEITGSTNLISLDLSTGVYTKEGSFLNQAGTTVAWNVYASAPYYSNGNYLYVNCNPFSGSTLTLGKLDVTTRKITVITNTTNRSSTFLMPYSVYTGNNSLLTYFDGNFLSINTTDDTIQTTANSNITSWATDNSFLSRPVFDNNNIVFINGGITKYINYVGGTPASYYVIFRTGIEGATVSFNGQQMDTDSTGQAIFSNIPIGSSLPYTVSKSGYNFDSGTIDVVNQDIIKDIALTANPESGSQTQTTGNTTITGNFQATIIDVTITNGSYSVNPNGATPAERFTGTGISITNNSTAPITSSITSFSKAADSPYMGFNDVLPDTYTDVQWQKMDKAGSESNLALAIVAKEPAEWRKLVKSTAVWAKEVQDSGSSIYLGDIDSKVTVHFDYNSKFGLSQLTPKTCKHGLGIKFDLAS